VTIQYNQTPPWLLAQWLYKLMCTKSPSKYNTDISLEKHKHRQTKHTSDEDYMKIYDMPIKTNFCKEDRRCTGTYFQAEWESQWWDWCAQWHTALEADQISPTVLHCLQNTAKQMLNSCIYHLVIFFFLLLPNFIFKYVHSTPVRFRLMLTRTEAFKLLTVKLCQAVILLRTVHSQGSSSLSSSSARCHFCQLTPVFQKTTENFSF